MKLNIQQVSPQQLFTAFSPSLPLSFRALNRCPPQVTYVPARPRCTLSPCDIYRKGGGVVCASVCCRGGIGDLVRHGTGTSLAARRGREGQRPPPRPRGLRVFSSFFLRWFSTLVVRRNAAHLRPWSAGIVETVLQILVTFKSATGERNCNQLQWSLVELVRQKVKTGNVRTPIVE